MCATMTSNGMLVHPVYCISRFNNDYFAKLRSHNGQLISNETVTYEVERGAAISRQWPAEVVTSLTCGLHSPSITPQKQDET